MKTINFWLIYAIFGAISTVGAIFISYLMKDGNEKFPLQNRIGFGLLFFFLWPLWIAFALFAQVRNYFLVHRCVWCGAWVENNQEAFLVHAKSCEKHPVGIELRAELKKTQGLEEEIASLRREKLCGWQRDDLFVFTNDVDWYVAHDWTDLQAVVKEHAGATIEEMYDDLEDWYIDAGEIKVRWDADDYGFDETPEPEGCRVEKKENCTVVIAQAAEWAKQNGRGFLCSTEY